MRTVRPFRSSALVSIRALAFAMLLCGCGPEPAAPPESGELRVISLSPAVSEILLELGGGADVVGVDRYSKQIPGLENVPSLGGLFSPDLERAIQLRPTLVFGVRSEQQRGFFDHLAGLGVRVETLSPYTLVEVLSSYQEIGELIGRPERGHALRASVERELAALRARDDGGQAGERLPTLAVVLQRDPLYVVGGGSFVSELIATAGGRNVFEDLESPYPSVSLEVLAERAPDLIIDTAGSDLGDALSAARAHWRRFSWVRRVEVVAQGVVTLPGPRLGEAARVLHSRIHAAGIQ